MAAERLGEDLSSIRAQTWVDDFRLPYNVLEGRYISQVVRTIQQYPEKGREVFGATRGSVVPERREI